MLPHNPAIGQIVNRTARQFRLLADQRLKPLGLSSGQLPVITGLMNGMAMSQSALVEHADIEQPTMAATLARMERAGIIERQGDPADGRRSLFTLSAETRAKIPEITAVIESVSRDALAGLSEAEREAFRCMLGSVSTALKAALRA